MGKVKWLELWCQLYSTWLPERDIRNNRPLDFLLNRVYICLHPIVPLFFQPSISLVVQILFRSPVIWCLSLLLAFVQAISWRTVWSLLFKCCRERAFCPMEIKWKLSGLLYECIVLLCSFNAFSRWLCSCIWCHVAWQQGTWWQQIQLKCLYEIWDSYGSVPEGQSLLGCDNVSLGE